MEPTAPITGYGQTPGLWVEKNAATAEVARDVTGMWSGVITGIITAGIASKELPLVDADFVAAGFVALIDGLSICACLDDSQADKRPELLKAYLRSALALPSAA